MPRIRIHQDSGRSFIREEIINTRGELVDRTATFVHSASMCEGQVCCLHNPSDHPMRNWRVLLRRDRRNLIERICSHQISHPDPDAVAYFDRIGVTGMVEHYCDGCCGRGDTVLIREPEREPRTVFTDSATPDIHVGFHLNDEAWSALARPVSVSQIVIADARVYVGEVGVTPPGADVSPSESDWREIETDGDVRLSHDDEGTHLDLVSSYYGWAGRTVAILLESGQTRTVFPEVRVESSRAVLEPLSLSWDEGVIPEMPPLRFATRLRVVGGYTVSREELHVADDVIWYDPRAEGATAFERLYNQLRDWEVRHDAHSPRALVLRPSDLNELQREWPAHVSFPEDLSDLRLFGIPAQVQPFYVIAGNAFQVAMWRHWARYVPDSRYLQGVRDAFVAVVGTYADRSNWAELRAVMRARNLEPVAG